jgi:hypothetical protein
LDFEEFRAALRAMDPENWSGKISKEAMFRYFTQYESQICKQHSTSINKDMRQRQAIENNRGSAHKLNEFKY